MDIGGTHVTAAVVDRTSRGIVAGTRTYVDVVEHGMGHASVVIAEQREHELVCVQWGDYMRLDS